MQEISTCYHNFTSVLKVDRAKYHRDLVTDIVDMHLPVYKYDERESAWQWTPAWTGESGSNPGRKFSHQP